MRSFTENRPGLAQNGRYDTMLRVSLGWLSPTVLFSFFFFNNGGVWTDLNELLVEESLNVFFVIELLQMFHLIPTVEGSFFVQNDIFRLNYG